MPRHGADAHLAAQLKDRALHLARHPRRRRGEERYLLVTSLAAIRAVYPVGGDVQHEASPPDGQPGDLPIPLAVDGDLRLPASGTPEPGADQADVGVPPAVSPFQIGRFYDLKPVDALCDNQIDDSHSTRLSLLKIEFYAFHA